MFDSTIIPAADCLAFPATGATPDEGEMRIGFLDADGDSGLFLKGHPEIAVGQAFSCLVQARAGDQVQVLYHQQRFFILSILQRLQANDVLVLGTQNMQLQIAARKLTLEIEQEFTVRAASMQFFSSAVKWISNSWRQLTKSLHIQASYAHRQVDTTDVIRARHMIQHADKSLSVRAKICTIQAEALLKMDGSQVHMG